MEKVHRWNDLLITGAGLCVGALLGFVSDEEATSHQRTAAAAVESFRLATAALSGPMLAAVMYDRSISSIFSAFDQFSSVLPDHLDERKTTYSCESVSSPPLFPFVCMCDNDMLQPTESV